MSRCIGYGAREDVCREEASAPRGIWCPGCEGERVVAITAQFERIGAAFAADVARMGAGAP